MTPSSPTNQLTFERTLPLITLTFVDVLGLTVILPLLHLYAAAYNATPLQIGLVAAAFPLAQVVGVPVMGALSDRFGRKPLLLISQVSTCFGFVLLALANSLELVILSRLIDGSLGANFATAQAAITDLSDEQNRTRALGLTGAAFGFGFLFGPAIALLSLELGDGNLALPAWVAACYSLISIGLTLFAFRETLPPHKRRPVGAGLTALLLTSARMVRRASIRPLLLLNFAQQVVFYGFESLLGLFLLSYIGLLGQGTALFFLYVGVILIYAQVRLLGKWSARYGERRLVSIALALLGVGLLLVALTPAQPHPFYVERITLNALRELDPSATEMMIGSLNVPLPDEANRGIGGILWLLVALIPLTIGAGMIRPALNSLMVARADGDSGAVLGVSASFVSVANAIAPLIGALIFQLAGVTAPFALGGAVMLALALIAVRVVRAAAP